MPIISFHPRPGLLALISVLILGLIPPVQADDYLKNGDLKEGLEGWHGDGEKAFLKADGTEGAEDDLDVTPVLKLKLSSGESHEVSQEVSLHDGPKTLHIRVDILLSSDFKRSTFPQDYTMTWTSGTYYWSALIIPTCDFWIRGGPGWFYKLADGKIGAWTTVEGYFDNLQPLQTRVISFCVPPGAGTVYVKNASAQP